MVREEQDGWTEYLHRHDEGSMRGGVFFFFFFFGRGQQGFYASRWRDIQQKDRLVILLSLLFVIIVVAKT